LINGVDKELALMEELREFID